MAKGGLTNVNITSWTIVKGLLILAVAALLIFLRDIVLLVLVAVLIATLIDPFADWMQKRNLPRGLAVILVYIALALMATLAGVLVVPNVVSETSSLVTKYAPYLEETIELEQVVEQVRVSIANPDFASLVETIRQSGISDAFPDVVSFLFSVFGGFLTAILILVLAFYFVVEEGAVKKAALSITPKAYREPVRKALVQGRVRIGYWIRGQLLLMFIVFLITYTILSLLGVPFALVLALLAGLLEIIPFIGPILASIPAILIALSVSPLQAVFVAISYFLLQQVEGDYLTPKIMQKVAGLNPIASIVAVLVGFKLAGVIGALISIPVTMVLGVIWIEWLKIYEKR